MKIKRGSTVLCDAYLKNNSFTVDEIMGEQTFIWGRLLPVFC